MSGVSNGGRGPGVAALLQYARLMNGTCSKCGCILPHRDSGKTHECPDVTSDEAYSRFVQEKKAGWLD